jgi:hypothetical protein
MEGNMRGPSTQDCEKSFARTGVASRNLAEKQARSAKAPGSAYPITWISVA